MSGFFQSEIVREAIKEMEELQQQIIQDTFRAPIMSKEEKKDHVELMRTFLEKQKNLYFRLSLSDDPEAVEMKEKIVESAKLFGLKENESIDVFFDKMENSLNRLEKTLDI